MFKFKNDPSCRTCGHNHYWRLNDFGKESCMGDCATKTCKCKAKNWVPLDNLEYLEGLHENKK